MQPAKSSLTVIALLALLASLGSHLHAQDQARASAPQAPKQLAKKSPAPQAAPAGKPPAKAAPPAKAKTAQATKPPAQKPAKGKKAQADEKAGPVAGELTTVARRDPFQALLSRQHPGAEMPENLPPGKAGLTVNTLRVDGLVRGPNGMIAVVSNPRQRVYFLREGDQLYDGRVDHITMEAVAFRETGKDAFGKPLERQVIKRLYPSPGEQR